MFRYNKAMDPATLKILKALADETRLSMVRHLAARKSLVSGDELIKRCALALNLSQPTMSHHFKKLVDSEVLKAEKVGTAKFYQLNTARLREVGIDATKL